MGEWQAEGKGAGRSRQREERSEHAEFLRKMSNTEASFTEGRVGESQAEGGEKQTLLTSMKNVQH